MPTEEFLINSMALMTPLLTDFIFLITNGSLIFMQSTSRTDLEVQMVSMFSIELKKISKNIMMNVEEYMLKQNKLMMEKPLSQFVISSIRECMKIYQLLGTYL